MQSGCSFIRHFHNVKIIQGSLLIWQASPGVPWVSGSVVSVTKPCLALYLSYDESFHICKTVIFSRFRNAHTHAHRHTRRHTNRRT